MTFPVFSQEDFIEFLKGNGVEIIETKYWDEFNRLIMKKDDYTFPFQMKDQYYFNTVCKICEGLDIEPPEDHKKCYDQINEMNRLKKKKK